MTNANIVNDAPQKISLPADACFYYFSDETALHFLVAQKAVAAQIKKWQGKTVRLKPLDDEHLCLLQRAYKSLSAAAAAPDATAQNVMIHLWGANNVQQTFDTERGANAQALALLGALYDTAFRGGLCAKIDGETLSLAHYAAFCAHEVNRPSPQGSPAPAPLLTSKL